MGDFLEALAWIAFAAFLVAAGGAALGGLLIWSLIQRAADEPVDTSSDPFDVYGIDEEETVEVPVLAPVLARWFDEDFAEFEPEPEPEPEPERAIAHRPMSATERLDGPTVRIRIGHPESPVPWWMGARHRAPESRLRTAPYVVAPREKLPTAEYPWLEEVG